MSRPPTAPPPPARRARPAGHGWGPAPPGWRRPLGLIAALAVGAAACSPGGGPPAASAGPPRASAPGITATSITIGSHQPLTGVDAVGSDEVAPASNAMFAWVNSHGGVDGRQIRYVYEDDGSDPTRAAVTARTLVAQGGMFAMFDGAGTATHQAVAPLLNAARVPDLFAGSACSCWDRPDTLPYTSGWTLDDLREAKILGSYIRTELPGRKVGYLTRAGDVTDDATRGLDDTLPSGSVVTRQTYDPATADVTTQVSTLRDRGAQVVAIFADPATTARVLLAADGTGYHPVWVVSAAGSDPVTLAALLGPLSGGRADAGRLLDGLVTDTSLPVWADTANPWIAWFRRIHDRYMPGLPEDGYTLHGLAVAYTFVRLMQQAGVNPTRDDVIRALHSADLSGPGLAPFGYAHGRSGSGFTGGQVAVEHDGVLQLTGPVVTTDGGDGGVGPYSGAPPAPPPGLTG